MKVARWPPEPSPRTPTRPGRVCPQRRRSPEPDCLRISNLPDIQETASLARDPCLQQSASSHPPQITRGIITPESPHPTAFSHSQGHELTFGWLGYSITVD